MPKRPPSLALFRDVERTLQTIARHNEFPAKIRCRTTKAAIHWTHRAHTYRARLREVEEFDMHLAPGSGSSPYDEWKFRAEEEFVIVEPREQAVELLLHDEVVPIEAVLTEDEAEEALNEFFRNPENNDDVAV